ncbi:MAG TPA: DUF523 domain-containing protein [Syntrophomonadaceae bacterium]|nr:DUF523 domain-containing protein [Syntrophomonadaceae bacterium]
MILISACLLGYNCKYNGGNNFNPDLLKLLKNESFIPICPEQLGGLPTPRIACEIQNATGDDVLLGKGKIYNKNGYDLTSLFVQGAKRTLIEAKKAGVNKAILKSKSPSCGVNQIYDGSFTSKLKNGDGVTTALLKQSGIEVISAEDYIKGEKSNESN